MFTTCLLLFAHLSNVTVIQGHFRFILVHKRHMSYTIVTVKPAISCQRQLQMDIFEGHSEIFWFTSTQLSFWL